MSVGSVRRSAACQAFATVRIRLYMYRNDAHMLLRCFNSLIYPRTRAWKCLLTHCFYMLSKNSSDIWCRPAKHILSHFILLPFFLSISDFIAYFHLELEPSAVTVYVFSQCLWCTIQNKIIWESISNTVVHYSAGIWLHYVTLEVTRVCTVKLAPVYSLLTRYLGASILSCLVFWKLVHLNFQ